MWIKPDEVTERTTETQLPKFVIKKAAEKEKELTGRIPGTWQTIAGVLIYTATAEEKGTTEGIGKTKSSSRTINYNKSPDYKNILQDKAQQGTNNPYLTKKEILKKEAEENGNGNNTETNSEYNNYNSNPSTNIEKNNIVNNETSKQILTDPLQHNVKEIANLSGFTNNILKTGFEKFTNNNSQILQPPGNNESTSNTYVANTNNTKQQLNGSQDSSTEKSVDYSQHFTQMTNILVAINTSNNNITELLSNKLRVSIA